jgi:hypothetical protein
MATDATPSVGELVGRVKRGLSATTGGSAHPRDEAADSGNSWVGPQPEPWGQETGRGDFGQGGAFSFLCLWHDGITVEVKSVSRMLHRSNGDSHD